MTISIRTAAAAAALLAFAGATPALAETRTYDLAPFTGIDAAVIDLEVSVGGSQSVMIENRDGDFDDLEVRVRRGVLEIGPEGSWRGRSKNRFTATITVPALDMLDLSAGADADVTGVEADRFSIDVSSGAHAEISGTCGELSVDVSSGGRIRARELICRDAVADASSGGSARIHASQSIEADVSSGGYVRVYGGPKAVSIDSSSGGSVDIEDGDD